MDSLKEDDSAAKPPLKGISRGGPSILYFVGNIPQDAEKLKFEVISHFQKRKRFKGGEIVEKEYQVVGPYSALLLFENAEEVSEVQTVPHHIKDQEVELYPLVTEHVVIEMGGSSFFQALMSSSEMTQLTADEQLLVQQRNNKYTISGNWLSIQNFRERFRQFMINELKKHEREGFAGLFTSSSETIESTAHPKTEAPEDTSSDKCISAKGSSLNPDVLALMQKTGAYQHPALSYDLQTATININHDDPAEKEKIKEELFVAYRNIMMNGKLKEYVFPVEDLQQAHTMVDECMKAFNHAYLRYDSEKKEIKCLSTDARQMQNVRRRLKNMKKDPKVKSVSIDLPKKSRKVTIKLGDIIEEEVDVIVNAANDRLMHAGGVAAAIDKASYGAVQKESSKIIEQTGTLPTGQVVITSAGGNLKCKLVVHAVGPIASQHKDHCGPLLHYACVNSMLMAQHNKAKSVSFPPISSGIFGVSKELVADVMLSSLCSYTCDDPELLNDVRIVIIDEATYDVFLKFFHKEKGNLELPQYTNPASTSKSATYNPPRNSPLLTAQNSVVSIDLPQVARRVTIKLGDIVQEQVDIIVNAANMYLSHTGGVAAAINKASGGAVQRECTNIISLRKLIPTGDALATTAGGSLKCKFVVHAVGPIAFIHKDQCAPLLKKACINAMSVAKNFEATSIAFPPISSGDCGVPNDIVANVMLSTLCRYKCNVPTLLTDVRIVIIDKPTYEVFLNVLQREQQSLGGSTTTPEVLKPATFQYDQSGGNFLSGNATKFPGHAKPISYSHAAAQQPTKMKGHTSDSFDSLPTKLSRPNSHDLPGTPDKHAKILPVTSEPQRDSDNVQGDLSNNSTQPQSITSNSDINGTANTIEESSRSHKSGYSNNNKEDHYGEDVPIDSFKESSNKENSDYVIIEKPPGFDNSVDPQSTNKNPSDNTKLPGAGDPSGSAKNFEESSGEQHSPNPEAAKDNLGLPPQQKHVSINLHTKHLPPAATGVQTSLQNSEMKDKSKEKKNDESEKIEDCPICFDKLKDKAITAVTTCKHCKQAFCKGCLDEALQHKPYCPTCTVPLRKVTGHQPLGATMTTHTYQRQKLPGYEQYGTIQIHYNIPNGKQGKEHPNPGQMFHGTSRTAYVPDSPQGRKVVRLLKKAFEARLIFTIGTSHTSGATNVVVWNDIHHKTSVSGGPTNYGYPDPTYLSRVLEELAAKGIKE